MRIKDWSVAMVPCNSRSSRTRSVKMRHQDKNPKLSNDEDFGKCLNFFILNHYIEYKFVESNYVLHCILII